jgi:hypothetical protein
MEPAGQVEHAEAPAPLYVPAAHWIGTVVAVVGQNEPAGQPMHPTAPDPLYEPAGQAELLSLTEKLWETNGAG